MTVLLAAVGALNAPVQAIASIERIWRREGDSLVQYRSWTSGTLSRQNHIDEFLRSEHDSLFMLDTDMQYPANCLERLREHDLPIVCGLYLRRDPAELLPAAWEEPLDVEEFPHIHLLDFPKDDLIPVGAVGHGFLLMKRCVVEDINNALSGAPFMVRSPVEDWTGQPGLHVGPDVRMSLWARRLGYRIWMDTGCRAKHYVQVALDVEHYLALPWRQENDWRGRTALARIVRRSQMDKGIRKEDVALLYEQAQADLKGAERLKAEREAEIQQFTIRMQAELRTLDASIHYHTGRLRVLELLGKAMVGELDIVPKGPGASHE